jgi:hypothetical protein
MFIEYWDVRTWDGGGDHKKFANFSKEVSETNLKIRFANRF